MLGCSLYSYSHTYIHTYIYIYIHVRTCTYIHTYIHTSYLRNTCIHTQEYIPNIKFCIYFSIYLIPYIHTYSVRTLIHAYISYHIISYISYHTYIHVDTGYRCSRRWVCTCWVRKKSSKNLPLPFPQCALSYKTPYCGTYIHTYTYYMHIHTYIQLQGSDVAYEDPTREYRIRNPDIFWG